MQERVEQSQTYQALISDCNNLHGLFKVSLDWFFGIGWIISS